MTRKTEASNLKTFISVYHREHSLSGLIIYRKQCTTVDGGSLLVFMQELLVSSVQDRVWSHPDRETPKPVTQDHLHWTNKHICRNGCRHQAHSAPLSLDLPLHPVRRVLK